MTQDIEELLQDVVLPENFGFGDYLAKPLSYLVIYSRYGIKDVPMANPDAYECFGAAVLAQERLSQHGIASTIWSGKDELGIWNPHNFLELDDGTIVDITPFYRMIGANHKKESVVTPEFVSLWKDRSLVEIYDGATPMRYYIEDNGRSYLCNLGVSDLKDPFERRKLPVKLWRACDFKVYNQVIEFIEGEPVFEYDTIFDVDRMAMAVVELDYGPISIESFLGNGSIKRKEKAYALSSDHAGTLRKKKIRARKVRYMKDIAARDEDIVKAFMMNLLTPEIDNGINVDEAIKAIKAMTEFVEVMTELISSEQ